MDLIESFLTALESLSTNKMRAILTMLGIIIGVAAVITLLSVGNGVSNSIEGEIQGIGSNLISVLADMEQSSGYPTLSVKDLERLGDPFYVPAVAEVTAEVRTTQQVLYAGNDERLTVSGITPNFFQVRNLQLAYGNLINESDLGGQTRVAVLGADAAEELFGLDGFPIGQTIKIRGVQYRVIGVLERKGGLGFGSEDEQVFVPMTTAQSRLSTRRTQSGDRAVSVIYAQAIDEDLMVEATEQIALTLRDLHGIAYQADDDFTIFSQTDILAAFGTISATINLFLGAIAGISLVVGGIGIMNIMLVSVTERTREIGIRKAVGALRRDILIQFLIESLVLSLIGGLLGIGLGITASQVISSLQEDLTPVVSIGTVTLAFCFSAAIGLIFGIYPAWRAARLRPIEALRYE